MHLFIFRRKIHLYLSIQGKKHLLLLIMSSNFYASITQEDEKNIGDIELKAAVREISICYSKRSLNRGPTYLDYNKPNNRCAYFYKYANLHTGLVTKYFRKMVAKKQVRSILNSKKSIKICSLGGGPGTDIVGVFKALAVIPHFHQRITEVSVLDICKGWDASFQHIMSDLMDGKGKGVPDTFVNKKKFKKELIEVDLLGPLPGNVKKIISNADIICMVKFVSVILAKQESTNALRVLGDLFKHNAIILFIDNFQGNSFESIEYIAGGTGFEVILGPLRDEKFIRQSQSKEAIYGCLPQTAARVSVIGWIKTSKTPASANYFSNVPSSISLSLNEDNNWETESEIYSSNSSLQPNLNENVLLQNSDIYLVRDNYTQTEQINCSNEYHGKMASAESRSSEMEELPKLIAALTDLLTVMEEFVPKRNEQYCCCFKAFVNQCCTAE